MEVNEAPRSSVINDYVCYFMSGQVTSTLPIMLRPYMCWSGVLREKYVIISNVNGWSKNDRFS